MKNLTCLLAALLAAVPLAAHELNHQITRAVSQALTNASNVKIQVKLTKPVRMSDVMFRRPRGKDLIIDWKQKENTCTGTLRAHLHRVYLPTRCVQDKKYQIAQIKMTFANGKKVQMPGRAVHILKDTAFIALQ